MKAIALYILLSFVRVLIKNCKTIFLAKEDVTRASLLAGVNAVLAANLVKMVVELNILTATLIAFFVNVAGCFVSITISKKLKIDRNMEKNENEKLVLNWTEEEGENTARVGVMYCFHSCDINRN